MDIMILLYRKALLEHFLRVVDEIEEAIQRLPGSAAQDASEVLIHLQETEQQIFVPCVKQILQADNPLLEGTDLAALPSARSQVHRPLSIILAEYRGFRNSQSDLLHSIPPEGWNRSGRHHWWGVRTLQWWVEQNLANARRHLWQLRSLGT